MSDPPRLLSPESAATELERRLLGAWADERPTLTARDAALAAVGVGSPSATALAMAKVAKWALLLLGLAAPVVVLASRAHTQTSEPVARVETPLREDTARTLEVKTQPPIAVGPAATPPRVRALHDTLPAEIAALDRARAALRDGDPERARAIVNGYDASFPRGALREEAMVVRIEALVAAGNLDEARRRTASFAASHPNSPHVARLRHLLQEP